MGRWSQRRLAGGGTTPQELLRYMVAAYVDQAEDPTRVQLVYNRNVTGSNPGTAGFRTTPGNFAPTSVDQSGVDGWLVQFSVDVSGQAAIVYTGHATTYVSPQTHAITVI